MRFARYVVAVASLATGVAVQAVGYNYTALAPSGATTSDAWDVNNLGHVVGSYGSDSFSNLRGYLWDGKVFTTLAGPAGALTTSALGVSDSGVVVGSYIDRQVVDGSGALVLGDWRGFILRAGVYTSIDVPWAMATMVRGISPNGRYVSGNLSLANGAATGFVLDLDTGSLVQIGSSAERSLTVLQGINNLGQVVGDERVFDPVSSGWTRTSFLFDLATGGRTNQNLPEASSTVYRDINDAGQLAGFMTLGGVVQGFTGTPQDFQVFTYGHLDSTLLQGINNSGWLVGSYAVAAGESQAFLLTPVPEPATLALWLCGLFAVGFGARSRRRT